MQCIECASPAVALCPRCSVAQCANHLARNVQWARRSGALAGCTHPDRPRSNSEA